MIHPLVAYLFIVNFFRMQFYSYRNNNSLVGLLRKIHSGVLTHNRSLQVRNYYYRLQVRKLSQRSTQGKK
jgi:hypothetical protein